MGSCTCQVMCWALAAQIAPSLFSQDGPLVTRQMVKQLEPVVLERVPCALTACPEDIGPWGCPWKGL